MPNQIRKVNPVVVAEQTAKIFEMTAAGKSVREIAETLNLSPTTVQKRKKASNSVVPMKPRNTEIAKAHQLEVYERRLRGQSPYKIAEEMQMSLRTVYNHIKFEIAERVVPQRDEYVRQSLDRMDMAIEKIMAQIEDNKAVARNAEVLVKIMERQAKLLGYDAPLQTENLVIVDTKPEVLNLIEQARAKMEERESTLRATAKRLDSAIDAEIVDEI